MPVEIDASTVASYTIDLPGHRYNASIGAAFPVEPYLPIVVLAQNVGLLQRPPNR